MKQTATDALRAERDSLASKRDRLAVAVDRLERCLKSLGEARALATAAETDETEDEAYPKRKPFRRLVFEAMSRTPKSRITISMITQRMRRGGAPEFGAPFKTALRGRIAVELAAMARQVSYPIYRSDQGVYIYDETRKKRGTARLT